MEKKVRIHLTIPEKQYYELQKLVEAGFYLTVQEAIRDAIKHFLKNF